MTPHPLNVYRQTEVQSRSPLELVVLLYDGALRFLDTARDAFERNDIAARRQATSRLLAIVSELQATLDLEHGGDVAANLDALYGYITRRVVDATVSHSPAPLDEVRRLLETLRDAWQTIACPAPAVPTPPHVPNLSAAAVRVANRKAMLLGRVAGRPDVAKADGVLANRMADLTPGVAAR